MQRTRQVTLASLSIVSGKCCRFPGNRGAPIFLLGLSTVLLIELLLLTPICIVTKWVLMGRYREGNYPLWGRTYLRWWMVRTPSPAHYVQEPNVAHGV
jgi:hypothetical protein